MAFTLSAKGKNTINFGENMITSASIDVNKPINSIAKSSSMSALLHITGNLVPSDAVNTLTQGNSETKALLDWSLVPATNSEAYCDVTINVITAGTTFRTIQFPNAFVIQYNEFNSSDRGVGGFKLLSGQKADEISSIKTFDDTQPSAE